LEKSKFSITTKQQTLNSPSLYIIYQKGVPEMSFEELINDNVAKVQRPLSYIIKIILIISIIYATYFHLWRVLFIDILLLILVFLPSIIRRYNIEIPREMELILLCFVILSFFLGDIRGMVIQAFFGLAIGFVVIAFLLILIRNSKIKVNPILMYIFTISFSLGIGTMSELAKFTLKTILGYEIGIADYHYAISGLTFVLLGSFISTTLALSYLSGQKIPILKHLIKRFKTKNPNLFIERIESPEEIIELIKKGENEKLEFKSTLRTNLHTGEHDRKIEHSTLKTIASLLNTEGGTLLIGVSDNGSIFGIERDHFQSNDKFNLHFTNLIKEYIGNEFLPFLHFELVLIENKNILKIDCMKSNKPVFLKFRKEEEFYIRIGAATVQIMGSKLVNYINNNFRN